MRFKITYIIFLLFADLMAVWVFQSCAPTKPTFSRKAYNNLTAHFNPYFNGNESLKEGIAELNKVADDDYTMILPVYKTGTKENAQSISTYMDKTVKKTSIVIHRHSFAPHNKSGKEYCKWIDRSYLLMGKAYFYKQDYTEASSTFDFVYKKYNNPIKYEAILWYIKSKTQKKDFTEAPSLLAMVESKLGKDQLTKKTEKELPIDYADYLLKKEDYIPASAYLNKAIEVNKKRKVRSRLIFILAQIKQKNNVLDTASQLYQKVIKLNPPYVMAFNAEINMAKCFDASTGDSKVIIKQLQKMLKDSKNREYLDQIYYALAEVYLKQQDTAKALANYKFSASSSIKNVKQKGITYLTIADIYYHQLKYRDAQVYYDSACSHLPNDYPNYQNILAKKEVLTELVKNLKIVEFEDSMQALAKLPDKERMKAIDRIISEIIKEEQQKQLEEAQRQKMLSLQRQNDINQQGGGNAGSWYFYNSSTMSFGYTEFLKKWGKRKLEDLWMLNDKKAVTFDFEEGNAEKTDSTAAADTVKKVVENPKDRSYYIKRIPLTPEAKQASTKRIMDALFNAGYIYFEELKDYSRAIQTFELFLKRFPGSDYEIRAYYYLYKIYQDALANSTKASYYKDLILSKYSDSDYAKILSNPDYFKQMANQQSKSSLLYKETYVAFLSNQYDVVTKNSDEALTLYKKDKLIPKFELLKALTIEKTGSQEDFKVALQELIKKYPKGEEKERAQNILTALSRRIAGDTLEVDSTGGLHKKVAPKPLFTFNDSLIHIYVLIADINKVNIKNLEKSISDFNNEQYGINDMTVSSLVLDDRHQMITVANFRNKETGMKYYNTISKNKKVYLEMQPEDYTQFIISTENYSNFLNKRKTKEYLEFFKKNYLK